LKIRIEKESDVPQIAEIHNQAFNGTDEGQIVENLRKNKNLIISLVCEIDGKIVGHIAYSPIHNKNKEIIGIGLAPVGVLPSYQNQGIGSQLTEQGNKKAFTAGFTKLFVLGDPKYYCRFGFVLAKGYNFYCEFDPEGNHFMVLGAQAKKPEKAIVYYCNEFNV
jgi:putative acetyltransferase